MSFEAVIGLEVHAQLRTRTKLFCPCPLSFGEPPNTNTCQVCVGLPGVLPVLNSQAVKLAMRAAAALDCSLQLRSQWSRKNYFYPDLPKGYQITQYHHPVATGGELVFQVGGARKTLPLTRIHLEEDAGKSVHDPALAGRRSFVDFNRAGTPLIEIVSEPALHSGQEAAAAMKALRQLLRYTGVCDGNMEEGSLRCDANVSIRPAGVQSLGTRTELKNLNSFRFLQQAIEYEILRQEQIVEAGGTIVQETRLWDAEVRVTRPLRSKEEAHDYRYFPEPDLPELLLTQASIDEVREELPELPAAKLHRYVGTLSLRQEDAEILTEEPEVAAFFEQAAATCENARSAANWVIHELLGELRGRRLADLPVGPTEMAELIQLIDNGTISGKIAKEIFAHMIEHGGRPEAIVEAKGLRQVTDTSSIGAAVDRVIQANPESVESYQQGKAKVLGFLVGQVMKATSGKANPKMVNELLREKLK